MNRNTIIGFVLIAAIMIFYTVYMTPSKEEMAQKQRVQDSIAQVQQTYENTKRAQEIEEAKKLSDQEPVALPVTSITGDNSDSYIDKQSKFAVFANSSDGEAQIVTVETDLVIYEINTKGGFITNATLKDYQTYDSLPLRLFNPDFTTFGLTFFAQNRVINTQDFFFIPSDSSSLNYQVSDDNTLNFAMRLYADLGEGQYDESKYIEYLYTFKAGDYMFDFTLNLVNMQGIVSANTSAIELEWYADLLQQEISIDQFNGSTIYYKHYRDDVDYLSESDDDEEQIKTKLKWVSFKQRFFSSTIIAKDFFTGGKMATVELEDKPFDRYLKSMRMNLDIPFNFSGNTNIPMSFYLGPNKFNTLKKYNLELERQIPIGWSFFLLGWINQYIVIPVFDWLGGYGWNYGIVILVLTIMLKLVLFPIAYKTYMSSAKMRVLKPEVDEIKHRDSDKKHGHHAQAQAKNRASR